MHWVFITGERGGRELLCIETGMRVREDGQGGAMWSNRSASNDLLEYGTNVSFNNVVLALKRSGDLIE